MKTRTPTRRGSAPVPPRERADRPPLDRGDHFRPAEVAVPVRGAAGRHPRDHRSHAERATPGARAGGDRRADGHARNAGAGGVRADQEGTRTRQRRSTRSSSGRTSGVTRRRRQPNRSKRGHHERRSGAAHSYRPSAISIPRLATDVSPLRHSPRAVLLAGALPGRHDQVVDDGVSPLRRRRLLSSFMTSLPPRPN